MNVLMTNCMKVTKSPRCLTQEMWATRVFISLVLDLAYVKHAVSHLGSSFSTNILVRQTKKKYSYQQ